MALTLSELLRTARHQLSDAGIAGAAFDARILVEHFTGTTRADEIANPQRKVAPAAVSALEAALTRRIAGESVHRIMGFREFYGLRLELSADTLEPRPDTETLVDAVLPFVRATVERTGCCRILDLGTGTGAIALALLATEPAAQATGVDISERALVTAVRNAQALGLAARFVVLESDWFEKVSGRFDVIISNPPYIPAKDIDTLQIEVRGFDPRRALDGGEDGLEAYRTIADGAARHLNEDGIVVVEIGAMQNAHVERLFGAAGYESAEVRRDLAGNDRVIVFRRQ